ncbi:MAG: mechanosensitive ion channel [Candidatus Absconditabacterales bacterium]|nr:mechanosensitive ion channel [Candidatus Absconditabacterales bacterium]
MTGDMIVQEPNQVALIAFWLRTTIIYPLVIALVIIFLGRLLLGRCVARIQQFVYNPDHHVEEDRYKKKIADTVGSVVSIIGWFVIGMVTMNVLGLNMTLLMGGLSFGIGFAMEKTFTNLVGAILLITNPRIKIGQTYSFQGSINQTAKRESINPKYSILRLLNKTRLLVPNHVMVKTPIKYISQDPLVRMDYEVAIARDTDCVRACSILKEVINSFPDFTNKDQTFAYIQCIKDGAIILAVSCYRAPKQSKTPILKLNSLVRKHMIESLRANNIEIPYPYREVIT